MITPVVGAGWKTLADGKRWYSYSGVQIGGAAIPTFVDLVDITSTGLKDSFIKINFFYGQPISDTQDTQLGGLILINDVEVFKQQPGRLEVALSQTGLTGELFVPRQSKLTVKSINTAANTNQERGACVIGWFL